MLLVKTHLNKSKIHGIGLYADQFIPKGKAIYRCSPGLDINLSKNLFNKLDRCSKKQIKHYGHMSLKKNKWHLAFDDIRFCNHSKNGNITVDGNNRNYQLIAKRNINRGEEITQNYEEFENLRKELR